MQYGFDKAVRDRLGHRVGNADGEAQRLRRCLVTGNLEQFIAEREDLLGVAQDASASFGDFQAATRAAKQLDLQ